MMFCKSVAFSVSWFLYLYGLFIQQIVIEHMLNARQCAQDTAVSKTKPLEVAWDQMVSGSSEISYAMRAGGNREKKGERVFHRRI